MKKLAKLQINPQRLISCEGLLTLRGGYDGNPNPDCSVTDKIKACKDLYEGHGCCWTWQGVVQYGKCRANPPDYELHCSDLN